MTGWSDEHESLLVALRARDLVPLLVERLTNGHQHASERDVVSMRDWVRLLEASPAGHTLRAHLGRPASWPEIWFTLQHDFSPRMNHHHALLLDRLAERATTDRRFSEALRLRHWTIIAWASLVNEEDYLRALADRVSEGAGTTIVALLEADLIARLESYRSLGEEAMKVETCEAGKIDELALQHSTDLLNLFSGAVAHAELPETAAAAEGALAQLRRAPLRAFDKKLASLNTAEAESEALLAPWRWLVKVWDCLGPRPDVDAEIISRGLDLLWTLRRLERDEIPAFPGLIELLQPSAERLAEALLRQEVFGHNSRGADFFVFIAEKESDLVVRRGTLERALEICPGHRNALKLLSYAELQNANQALVKLVAIPSPATRIKASRARAASLRDDVEASVRKAEEIFPFNEDLESYRSRLREQCERLRIQLEDDA